jgi:hypothetical protein
VPLDVRPAAAAQRSRAIKTRGLKKADRKVELIMDRKNVSFANSLFNQNGGNVEFEFAIGHERWMLKSPSSKTLHAIKNDLLMSPKTHGHR